MIIDLRNNRGGAAPSVMYFASFLVDGAQRIKLMTYHQRITETTEVRVTAFSEPTPTSYLGKPVRLLTSSRTFSAGEGFAYQLQVRKIALTVGENTGDSANPGGGQPISSQLAMFVPTSSTVHPITGTNWEGVGIKPDIPAEPSEALSLALRGLGQRIDANSVDELSEANLFMAGSAL